jgi:Holliday junction resolvase RusA-like endonuclease
MILEFTVPGEAAPQGSKRAVRLPNGRTVLLESSKRLKPWRGLVSMCAAEAWKEPPTTAPVELHATFTFVRPKSHFTAKGALKSGARPAPGKPDLDKLARGLCDGLTGIVYVDDSQIVRLNLRKEYGPTASTTVWVSAP